MTYEMIIEANPDNLTHLAVGLYRVITYILLN